MGRQTGVSLLISADAHVGEPQALLDRVPEEFRRLLPRLVHAANGDVDFEIAGVVDRRPLVQALDAEDREREFRSDLSQGTDLDRRMRDMAREGVDAQVVFPNLGLASGGGSGSAAYYEAWSRAYNEFVWEVFAPQQQRFKPAAMIPIDDVGKAIEETTRSIERGFASIFLPSVVPWQPYSLEVYEPLWSLVEEARIPIDFHVFSGNLAMGGEFGDVWDMNSDRIERAKQIGAARLSESEHLETVVGMAAGMSPILELTGGGVLERHPGLRFVVTESECGWLAWALQAMDQMQERRRLYMHKLPLRASDYFRRQGAITITDDPVALHNVEFTGVDGLLWGNDYPHDEGTWPNSGACLDGIKARLSPEDADKVLWGNAARIYGFDVDYLAARKSEIAALA